MIGGLRDAVGEDGGIVKNRALRRVVVVFDIVGVQIDRFVILRDAIGKDGGVVVVGRANGGGASRDQGEDFGVYEVVVLGQGIRNDEVVGQSQNDGFILAEVIQDGDQVRVVDAGGEREGLVNQGEAVIGVVAVSLRDAVVENVGIGLVIRDCGDLGFSDREDVSQVGVGGEGVAVENGERVSQRLSIGRIEAQGIDQGDDIGEAQDPRCVIREVVQDGDQVEQVGINVLRDAVIEVEGFGQGLPGVVDQGIDHSEGVERQVSINGLGDRFEDCDGVGENLIQVEGQVVEQVVNVEQVVIGGAVDRIGYDGVVEEEGRVDVLRDAVGYREGVSKSLISVQGQGIGYCQGIRQSQGVS